MGSVVGFVGPLGTTRLLSLFLYRTGSDDYVAFIAVLVVCLAARGWCVASLGPVVGCVPGTS